MPDDRLRTSDAVVFLPGLMGSQLSDERENVVWGFRPGLLYRQVRLGDVLTRLRLDDASSDDGIRASDILRTPVHLPLLDGLDPYTKLVSQLDELVLEPAALLCFPYDWRRSIEESARRLEPTAYAHLQRWREAWKRRGGRGVEPLLTFVCHSMGGLVARYAVEVLGERLKEVVRQIVTLGTPFEGSLKSFRVLADGSYLPFHVLADELRDAGRTFPGLYDLIARYECLARGDDLVAIESADVANVGASDERAAEAFDRLERLASAVRDAGTNATVVRPLVGLRQPTAQSVTIQAGTATFAERLGTIDYTGDGTVFRRSAAPAGTTPSYLPQRHGAIAKTPEALTFVDAVLTEAELGPLQAEPTGIGIRVPDAVPRGQPFEVEILVQAGRPSCRIQDAETNQQVAAPRVQSRDGRLVASATLASPGLYRVRVSGGGFSPVEEFVAVIDPAVEG